MRPPKIKNVRPSVAIAGGKVTIEGSGFDPEQVSSLKVSFDGLDSRPLLISKNRIVTLVPDETTRGPVTITLNEKKSNSFDIIIGQKLADNIHAVDSPVFDSHGNLYTTFSGKRGETVPVSVFKIDQKGLMTPFLSNIPNATSLAFDSRSNLYVSSRFEGTVYKATPQADVTIFAKDLGVPTGLAFDAEGFLYVGDRGGRILKITPEGQVSTFAEMAESMIAFHLAFDREGNLLVSNPGLSSQNSIILVDRYGKVMPLYGGFGRPQGLTVDADGNIYVCEAKAGESAVLKISSAGEITPFLSGPVMVGVAVDRKGKFAVATQDAIYLVPSTPSSL
jgi:sugar lactone lactonase YvrE